MREVFNKTIFSDNRWLWQSFLACLIVNPALCVSSSGQESPATSEKLANSSTMVTQQGEPEEPLNFSLSASVPRDREIERKLLSTETDHSTTVERPTGKNGRMVSLIREILKKNGPGLILNRGTMKQPHTLSKNLILAQPESVQSAYRRSSETEAREQLQQARESRDLQLLNDVALNYPLTTSGELARKLWNAARQDRGIFPPTEQEIENGRTKQRLGEGFQPSAVPAWTAKYNLSQGAIETILAGQRDLRENGLTPFSPWEAKFVDDLLITVSPRNIEARNTENGTLVWSRPLQQYGARILDQLDSVESPLRSWNLTRATLFRVFGESIYAKMATDGTHLFITEANESGGRSNKKEKERRTANRITCLNTSTGAEVWSNSTLAKSRAFLCGPPTIYGEELLILAEYQHTSQIYLLALDKSTGELSRKLPLAEVARPVESDSFEKRDGRRQSIACKVEVARGKAYCPTSAGLLAVVDLNLWNLDWAYRYPRNDVPSSGTGLLQPKLGLTGFQWWSDWHEIQTVLFEDFVLFASPESQLLTLFDQQTRNVLWTVDREDSLFVATASTEHGILAIGANSARCLDTNSGNELWKTPLNIPAGRGVQSETSYLLPDSEHGWTSIDLSSGDAKHSRLNLLPKWIPYNVTHLQRPRNYFTDDGELYEASFLGIRKLQRIEKNLRDIDSLTPAMQSLAKIESGKLKDSGQIQLSVFDENKHTNEPPPSKTTPPLERLLLTQEFIRRSVLQNSNGQKEDATATPAEQLYQQEFLRAWFRAAFEMALKSNQWEQAVQLLVHELTLPMAEGDVTGRMRRFRLDRWLSGQLCKIASSMSDEEQAQFAKTIEDAIKPRLLDHPEEVRFLEQIFAATPWPLQDVTSIEPESRQSILNRQLQRYKSIAEQSIFLNQKQSFEESQNENRLGIAYAHTIVYHLRGVSPRHFFTL